MAAEVNIPRNRRGLTVVLKSGDGTPKTYTLNFSEGSYQVTYGGWTTVRMRDENGDFVGTPRKGEQAGPSMIAITARVRDAGINTADAVLMDLVRQTGDVGYVGSDWTSTDTNSDLQVSSVVETIPTVGSNMGATETFTSCVVEPGVQREVRADGIFLTFTISSANAEPAKARLT
jgi:hypothetical protein